MRSLLTICYLCVALILTAGAAVNYGQSVFGGGAESEGWRLLAIGKGLKAMPERGKRAEDFVPPHWKVFTRADGDLDHDGISETVFVLKLDMPDRTYVDARAAKKDDEEGGTFMIAIVRPLPDKSWEFEDVNYSIGAIPAGDRDEFDISIKNNVLSIHSNTGGSLRFEETYRFRDRDLIGYDYSSFPVTLEPDSTIYALSENYLTGERTETTTTFNNKAVKGVDSVKRSTFKPQKTAFSETYAHCH
ncbi:MAG: hypothetical protein ACJ73D_05885 [Pyrinomonadaceae bacterium]